MGQLEDLIMALQHAEMQERLAEAGMSCFLFPFMALLEVLQ